MKKYSRLRAVIDLDAVMYNMEMMHANIEKGTKMVVVIKTDGNGRNYYKCICRYSENCS